MKKVIILILFVFVSFSNAQDKQSNKLPLKEKYIIKNILKNDEEKHLTFSFGGGFVFGGDSKNILTDMSFSTTFQFSRKFLFETKFDFCQGTHYKSDKYYIVSLIPQTWFNLYDSKLKLYTGIGIGLAGAKNFGILYPTGNAKIEYNFNKWFSINNECMFFPVMLKLNLNFKLPY